jgi:hypothetical protein
MDATIQNMAPDADVVLITIGPWALSISREENGEVWIIATDNDEGSETRIVLGQPGETQRV